MFILVIDDDEIMRELLTALFEAAGHRVGTAGSPDEGFRIVQEQADELDAVLTDLRMPAVDTLENLQLLRNSVAVSTRLIGMSGSDAEPQELRILDGFLLKPFSVKEFIAAVERSRTGAPQESIAVLPDAQTRAPVLDDVVYERMAKALPSKALRELYELTLEDVAKRAAAMRQAAEAGDSATCKSEAHAMKGGCGMVGALELRSIAADIETGAPVDTPVLEEIASATERLRRMLDALTL